ncbi:MAG: isoprenylcysteine carboxylmethyltransferase family protein [Anaerolineales bacterium]|nr:isoprenylcysteine carboxylmethyltransferase family protein [Anaerolineales bacterium]
MNPKKIMPTMYLLIAMIIMVALHFIFPLYMLIPPVWNLSGILPVVIGLAINLMADGAFKKANTTVKPFQESNALITSGVFRITRNPMYLGFVLILIGIALLLRSLSPFIVIIVFAILIDQIYIRVEERMLADKFGSEWDAYRQTTRRWI